MKKVFLALMLSCLSAVVAMAQVVTNSQPRSFSSDNASVKKSMDSDGEIPAVILERPTISEQPKNNFKSGRVLFGKHIESDINFMEEALVTNIRGGKLYRLMVVASRAYSLGFVFSDFELSSGSELYLYSVDKTDVLGAITSSNNKEERELKTAQIDGDSVVLELYVPSGVAQRTFRITKVIYDFANINDLGNSLLKRKSSHSCDIEVDINCDAGQGYQNIKRAVVKYTFSSPEGESMCTGTLINNSRNDGSPFLLTAAHCICTQEIAEKAVFYFNYEKAECGSDSIVAKKNTASGANLLATATTELYGAGRFDVDFAPLADFSLLRLTDTIHDSYKPYYAGFTTNVSDNISTVATVHHPNGDYKKISISSDSPFRDSYPPEDEECHYSENQHWHIAKWATGTTEGGSSGAPLLNNMGYIIGTLSGGYAGCASPRDDYFQMFSEAWEHDPRPEHQLKYWLAGTTNITTMPGYDPLLSSPVADDIVPQTAFQTVLYPNPAGDVIYIKVKADIQNPVLTIADIQGKLISTKRIAAMEAESPYELSTKNLKPGTYILIIMTGSGKHSCKFQKI